jgi:hypothetical protein
MKEKVNLITMYICNICNKEYASQSSLCNHNKKFHQNNNEKIKNSLNRSENNMKKFDNGLKKSDNIKTYECRKCNKIYNNKQSRWSHEQKCIVKNDDKIEQLEEKNKILEDTINELKKQVSTILQEKGKIHHKTLQKINNKLTNNNINNGNINNGQIINNTFVKFGDVDYQRILDNKQVKHILNQQFMSLEESIKMVHFNKDLPEYNNVFITNMRDDIGYIFNGKEFISVKKNEMITELIDSHVKEINLSLEKHKNKLNEKYVTRLEKFLDMLNDDDTKFTDQNNQRTYPSYKAYKINSLKLLIYNSSDKKKLDELNNMELHEKVYENDSDEIIEY